MSGLAITSYLIVFVKEINEYLMNRTTMEDHIIKFFFNNRDRYKIEDFLHKGQFEIECLIPVAEVMAEKFVEFLTQVKEKL